jgi:YD repeat-containing protein
MGSQVVQINDDPSPGDTYTWNAVSFDAFARPVDVQRYNSIGYSARESTAFKDDYAHWVLGLPLQTTNVVTGEEISRNVYDPNSLTLSERYRFGRKVMGYAFNAQGQLTSFTDGNNHTTTLGSYKRGIPQAVGYPDGTSQSLVVDDLGQIRSITNQALATTSYTYDAIGRLASITYPAGMNPKIFGYGYVTGAERGVPANHWRRSVTQGGKVQMTYFDAMLRPILSDTYRNDSAFYTSIRSGYDWKGRKIFQSYPYSGAPDITAMSGGVLTSYDVIGRATVSTQTSELGNLTTTTQYLAGAAKKVTDPKNNATTSWYQAFDQPSYDTVVKVQAPEGVVQTIQRDVYGNPLSITQGGAGQSVTKTMTYDAWHRLCRAWEPESGSEIMAYDGADNLAWSVSGASFNSAGACGQDQVAEASKTVRAYDAMNRVTSVLYPTGTAPSTFTYDALGNPATATSGNVGWTFGHNALGQLTAEVLAVDGWVWGLGYGYDGNGALSTVRYPDEEIVSYNPDALGRPTTVGGYASGISYFPDGDVASYYMGNGGIYSADKNARNLLHNFTYGKGGVPIVSEDFTYDGNGNVSNIGDVSGSNQRTKSMSYDGLNRLLSATASNLWGTESYTYDTLNNIRTLSNSSGTSTYNYDGANLLASISIGAAPVHTFQYDGRGNTVGKDGQVLNFDLANRLTSIPGKGQYTYDAAGRRVKKVTPVGTTYYAYNSAGQLMWEADPGTRLGSNYVYLGKKLIAKSTENIDILRPSQVKTVVSIVGIPQLAADGSTIDVTLDIANNGTRPLSANSQYPVQMGYHLIDQAGASTQPAAGVNLPADIPVGGHGTITMHVAADAVLGTGKKIRFGLLQAGVAWFQDWPGNNAVDAGPYSACPTAGTGNLCNNVTGLTPDQVNVALTITSGPTLSADGQSVLTTLDIANHGTVTLAYAFPHPINLGNHVIDALGAMVQNDVSRVAIPEIAPGQHAALTIATPASLLLGTGRRVQFELVQEGLHWFKDFGIAPVVAGPYVTLGGATSSSNGSFALSWQPIAGATSYTLQERLNNGAWATVQSSTSASWSASGRATGAYAYQVQACAVSGCAPYGSAWAVNVLLPPPVPASISASAPNPGPITVSWAGSATATRYVVNQQFNGGAWTTYYNSTGTSVVLSPAASGTYVYQVQACNSSGCSGFRQSNAVAITLPPALAPAIAGGGANHNGAYTISWGAVAGAATYNLVESANGGAWQQRQNTTAGTWSTSGKINGTYVYQVQACNAGGCGPWSAQAVITVSLPPPTPGWPRISQTGSSDNPVVTVSWSSVLYATRYELVEILPSGYTETVQNNSATTWSSLKLYTGTLQYKFRACNDVGCSGWSPTVAITLVSGG